MIDRDGIYGEAKVSFLSFSSPAPTEGIVILTLSSQPTRPRNLYQQYKISKKRRSGQKKIVENEIKSSMEMVICNR